MLNVAPPPPAPLAHKTPPRLKERQFSSNLPPPPSVVVNASTLRVDEQNQTSGESPKRDLPPPPTLLASPNSITSGLPSPPNVQHATGNQTQSPCGAIAPTTGADVSEA